MSTEFSDEPVTADDGVFYDEEVIPEHGILGFTLREILIVGVWLVAFVASFFPLYGQLSPSTLWMQGISWILPIGLPTVAVFLLVLRRFSPDGIRRVGSLGVDQFASVTFSVAVVYWMTTSWEFISVAQDFFLLSWVMIIEIVTMLILVALTVFAPVIPGLREDFRGRLVTLAHRNANPARPVIARPRPERPTGVSDDALTPSILDADTAADVYDDAPVPLTAHASGGALGTATAANESDYEPAYARSSGTEAPVDSDEDAEDAVWFESAPDLDTTRDAAVETETETEAEAEAETLLEPEPEPAAPPVFASQPFWALAATERDVFDERGSVLFRIGPDAWALIIEDRGGAYVVRHDDGRIGYLHDIEDITRG